MVRRCVDKGSDVDAVLATAIAADEPAMVDLVPTLVEALSHGSGGGLEPPPNPYKGLRAFDESDAADYFGRRDLIDEVLVRLRRDDLVGRLVLVVGGSGTGKSSVVRAGLLPRVRAGEVPGSDAWFVTTMLPGGSPFDALAESLRRVAVAGTAGLADVLAADQGAIDRVLRDLVPLGGQLLLVIDQFEELFTSASERDQRVFLAGLVHAMSVPDSRLRVVATLRADFYDRPLAVQVLGPLVNDATVAIAAMTPAELEAAIVEPAERVGRRVERPLVAELLGAVADEPAALPALQFTLYELAEPGDETLTLAAYHRLGRVDGAIAGRAEQLYQSLDEGEQVAVRRLFEHLVVIDADDEPTRRRAARGELSEAAADGSVDAAVDRWASARFLSLDRHPRSRVPTVEIAHEALLQEWPRLRRWIDQDRDTLMVLGHLREAAASWVALDRDPGALYRGAQLQVAIEVADARSGLLPPNERDFVAASRAERDREEAAETQRVARQARANRRLRAQLAVIGVALVVALVGGFIAVDQRSEAENERRDATARSLAAASSASLVDDPERSILLALAAVDATREHGGEVLPEAIEALHEAVARSRLVLSVPGVGGPVDWSPDGRTFVTTGPEGSGTVEIRDARTGAPLLSFRAHEYDINDVAFNADGSQLATTGADGALRVWDPATGEEQATFDYPAGGQVWGPSFSPDGSRVAAAWPETEVVRMFDVGAGREVWDVAPLTAHGTEFSPDGERLAIVQTDVADRYPLGTAFEDRTRRLVPVVVDAATGETAFTAGVEGDGSGVSSPEFGGDPSPGNGGSGRDAAWSPDGRFLATTSADGTVILSDAATGSRRFAIEAHTAPVNALAWSPDSARLATASDDGTARVTEIAADGGGAATSVAAQDTDRGLVSVAFSPGGDRIVTGVSGRTSVKVWDIGPTGGAEWLNVAGHSVRPGASALAFTPDGDVLVVGGEDGTIASWDVDSGRRLWTSSPVTAERGEVEQLAVSPDGLLVASAVAEGPVELWDASTGGHLRTVLDRLATQRVVSLTWSHDGEVLAVARTYDIEGRVEIVSRTGERVSAFYEGSFWGIGSASFSPDDQLLVTTRLPSLDNLPRQGLRVWDWQRGETVKSIEAPAITGRVRSTEPEDRGPARAGRHGGGLGRGLRRAGGDAPGTGGRQRPRLRGRRLTGRNGRGRRGGPPVGSRDRGTGPRATRPRDECAGRGPQPRRDAAGVGGRRRPRASLGPRARRSDLDGRAAPHPLVHRRGVPTVPRAGPVPGRLIRAATQLPHGCCATATALLHRRVRQRCTPQPDTKEPSWHSPKSASKSRSPADQRDHAIPPAGVDPGMERDVAADPGRRRGGGHGRRPRLPTRQRGRHPEPPAGDRERQPHRRRPRRRGRGPEPPAGDRERQPHRGRPGRRHRWHGDREPPAADRERQPHRGRPRRLVLTGRASEGRAGDAALPSEAASPVPSPSMPPPTAGQGEAFGDALAAAAEYT